MLQFSSFTTKMALRMLCSSVLRTGTDIGVSNARTLGTAAILCRRSAPLGPMPNEDIDYKNLESLEKYRSYTRYLKKAEEAKNTPAWWKTYRQYQEQEDPGRDVERVNIGLPHCRPSRVKEARERKRVVKENRRSIELERAMRLRTFKVSLDRVQAGWEETSGPYHVQRLADHYGIFKDLFPMAYFYPRFTLCVSYGQDSPAQVHYGNHLTPTEAAEAPQVSFEAEEGSIWTLLLTSPDEHLLDSEGEYVHWLVGNIPGGAVTSGEELCPYLAPIPAKGTGFHRYVYILFRQEETIDFHEDIRPLPCLSLSERSFKTVEFYRKHQDSMTPAGLSFFQSQWDQSVTHTFHNILDMKEPVFEFERPPVYHPPQVKYPHGQPLRYLDRYRDGKEHTYGIY
ncbi:39S ribosomal protein L38, mitochondrial-like [Oncorhynchus keta]|uniref:39S ribosomal protein L38, mitochondrial-like n=1 Tax=Oncorhynchus keta TaxID=8018 RepID=UPI0015FB7EE9|nr:39S ribosomal protein L38, mitochondrial-like [Oncorhynchus keta]